MSYQFVSSLEELAGTLVGQTVEFLPHQPMETALQVMRSADLALVSLAPGVSKAAFPSKTIAYLEAGCRLLVVAEPEKHYVILYDLRNDIPINITKFGERGEGYGLMMQTSAIWLNVAARKVIAPHGSIHA